MLWMDEFLNVTDNNKLEYSKNVIHNITKISWVSNKAYTVGIKLLYKLSDILFFEKSYILNIMIVEKPIYQQFELYLML